MILGKYFILSGIDGSGKSTQAEKLYNYLKQKGIPIVLTKEPGSDLIEVKVREFITPNIFGVSHENAQKVGCEAETFGDSAVQHGCCTSFERKNNF